MLGDIEHFGDRVSENRGMIPRVFEKFFSRIQLVRILVALWNFKPLGNRIRVVNVWDVRGFSD
jgi:hypothetical protein